jgi:NAD(P)-dependent dehydrogenase (short-subunit alcohol dehydrogenase family)
MSASDLFSIQGRVVVLTGGAGLYGRGLATMLAEAGATLVIASRDVGKLQQVAAEETARGFSVHAETLDQADEQSVLALRDRVLAKFGRVDGLVNNAVARPMKSPDAPVSAWEESMRVNATGLFLMTRAFGGVMCARKTGSIVNIGSIQGMVGPSLELYAGTNMGTPPPDYFFHKGGMENLTRYYAGVYGPHGVRVNCLAPGGFFNHQPEPFLTRYNEHTMLGRMADERDLGGAVIFLLSDAAKYITGANLPVDGGYTAK